MTFIDSHVHMDSIERAGLEAMALSGVTAVVADAAPMPGLAPAWQSVIDFFNRNLGYETERCKEFFIDVHVMVGINMYFVSPEYDEILKRMPDYLEMDRVVAVGEIGLEPRSKTCPDMAVQEKILRNSMALAGQYDKAVLLHTPPMDRHDWVEKYARIAREVQVNPSRILVSHVDDTILGQVLDLGFVADITVQPWRHLGPADAAEMIRGADLSRVVIDSDSSLRFGSDVLGIPRTALEMRRRGFSEDDIAQVLYQNPLRVFNIGKDAAETEA